MSVVALLGPARVPTLYKVHTPLAPCNAAAVGFAVQRLPSDPAGNFNLTLNGLVPGSAVQVQTAAGAAVLNFTSAGSSAVVPLTAYVTGSPLNDLRVKVRKGSAAPFYQPWSTEVTAQVGSSAIFVSQNPDE